MRFPEVSELEDDDEQWRLYQLRLKANDRNVLLVTGPPGSGKTVVALYRAQKILLVEPKATVNMVMFNNTLTKYCENCVTTITNGLRRQRVENPEGRFFVSTWHDWFGGWVKQCKAGGLDTSEWSTIEVQKNNYKKKIYCWDVIRKSIRRAVKDDQNVPGWNHLIIDEAQDFPKGFHMLAGYMRIWERCPSLMVLADENQQIGEDNSSIAEIASEIFQSLDFENPDKLYHHQLKSNFRNTRAIALVARQFYTHVGSEPPELPPESKMGDIPVLCDREKPAIFSTLVDWVVKIAKDSPTKKIGVVCDYTNFGASVPKVTEELKRRLPDRRVSHYMSGKGAKDLLNNLDFDSPGAITVLAAQSVKGLEFDTVVCIRSKELDSDYKRQSYVVVSRAREDLIMVSKAGNGFKAHLDSNTVTYK
ncbi:DUF2075 domain-containing protein [Planctomycetota bacterium]|nr:DUF2075 domain-containing protein [Planctomycetota bacterium]